MEPELCEPEPQVQDEGVRAPFEGWAELPEWEQEEKLEDLASTLGMTLVPASQLDQYRDQAKAIELLLRMDIIPSLRPQIPVWYQCEFDELERLLRGIVNEC